MWYHNRFPRAMSDKRSYIYRYSWDQEGLQSYPWMFHYLIQPEILAYPNRVVDKHDLRKYKEFNTDIVAAGYHESANVWRISLQTGDNVRQMTMRYPAPGREQPQNTPLTPTTVGHGHTFDFIILATGLDTIDVGYARTRHPRHLRSALPEPVHSKKHAELVLYIRSPRPWRVVLSSSRRRMSRGGGKVDGERGWRAGWEGG